MNARSDQQLYIVEADYRCQAQLVGHSGCSYASPPQPAVQALALVRILLNCPQQPLEASDAPWHARRRRRNAHDPPAPRLSRRAASALANIATERASARPTGNGPRPACGLARHVAPPSPLPAAHHPASRDTSQRCRHPHPPPRRRAAGFPERELAGAFAEAKAYTHAGTGAAAAVTVGTPRDLPANQQTNKPADELSIRLAS